MTLDEIRNSTKEVLTPAEVHRYWAVIRRTFGFRRNNILNGWALTWR